jgi:hypothetical protein
MQFIYTILGIEIYTLNTGVVIFESSRPFFRQLLLRSIKKFC